jgi:hypothetical protein
MAEPNKYQEAINADKAIRESRAKDRAAGCFFCIIVVVVICIIGALFGSKPQSEACRAYGGRTYTSSEYEAAEVATGHHYMSVPVACP